MAHIENITDRQRWTDDCLVEIVQEVRAEQERRWVLDNAEREVDLLVREYEQASGREDGDPWVQPSGVYDAYRINAEVVHDGRTWVSLVPNNVWEPGVSGWREKVPEGSDVVPEWVQPTGAHDAYMAGDRVTFRNKVYESNMDNNVWSPADYPAGWTLITEGVNREQSGARKKPTTNPSSSA